MGALMVMEISKKQQYIFKSKKLKDHIGASAIIRYITEEMFEKDDSLRLASYNGFWIFKGGGKSLFEFDTLENANQFIHDYSLKVISYFPGVELFMTAIEFDRAKDNVINSLENLFEKLAIKKSNRKFGFYQVDYGVNRICKESKMPANILSHKGREFVSSEIARKIDYAFLIESNRKEFDFFERLLPINCVYHEQFQDQRDSSKNMVAVVHIDGNNMGQRILSIKKRFESIDSSSNQAYLDELKNFSESVEKAYIESFKEMLEILKKTLQTGNRAANETVVELPIRPIIMAGDDICFIVEGSYGIECSRIFLEKLNQKYDSLNGKLTACAGIAIVKSKYPFFKAYELSEQLCSNAKKTLAINKQEASALDWHVSYGEISKSIWEIRNTEYVTDENNQIKLYQRPYLIDNDDLTGISIPNYKMFLDSKHMVDQVAKTSRNTIKSLRNALKTGPQATKDYFEIYRIVKNKMLEEEFINDASRSFDCIEVMDVFKQMEG